MDGPLWGDMGVVLVTVVDNSLVDMGKFVKTELLTSLTLVELVKRDKLGIIELLTVLTSVELVLRGKLVKI